MKDAFQHFCDNVIGMIGTLLEDKTKQIVHEIRTSTETIVNELRQVPHRNVTPPDAAGASPPAVFVDKIVQKFEEQFTALRTSLEVLGKSLNPKHHGL